MKTIAFYLIAIWFSIPCSAQKINKGSIHILYTPDQPMNRFIPSTNIGGAIDGHSEGEINQMLNPVNIEAMKSVGLKPVSYRLRTELADETWHWNPNGHWTDALNKQGYWVSDSVPAEPIQLSYGYRLPRRGNTHDQGNDDGYSKISDGDSTTFWKSNPYLDKYFTKESNELHPQWVIVDLGKIKEVNSLRINWGNPHPLSYKIDYAQTVDPDYFDPYQTGIWHSLPKKVFDNPKGENKLIIISNRPLSIRYLRISFTESSYTTTGQTDDVRDRLGFAMKELYVGLMDKNGKFHDWMHHSPDHRQSTIYVSSTDPWHRAADLDLNVEQVGIDRFFASGLAAGQPVLMPAALLYDTPENVFAMVHYLKTKNYPFIELEMGEEPEGQLISPVDYGALYYQWGRQIKNAYLDIRLGGPGFASLSFTEDDSTTFTESTWTSLFLNYLKKHQCIDLFNFFSFEWYPFDDICVPSAPQLAAAPEMLSIAIKNLQNNILPENTPLYLTEYGYSAYEGRTEVEIEGALMYADILGKFLELGGSKSFLYGYEPAFLQSDHCGYGNNMLLGLGSDGKINFKTASFYCMQMITHFWAQPADSLLEIYPFAGKVKNSKNQPLVVSYALRSPDGKWSIMLINKDRQSTWEVNVDIENTLSKLKIEWHPVQFTQYSKEQYHWINDGINSHPSLSLPPVTKKINESSTISLPPYSLTVIY